MEGQRNGNYKDTFNTGLASNTSRLGRVLLDLSDEKEVAVFSRLNSVFIRVMCSFTLSRENSLIVRPDPVNSLTR